MHGCTTGFSLLVNAEINIMGGVFDGGVAIGIKTSPRRAAIEKAQAELRQEYDVREERRKELEYLEKGGNPLDFKFGNAASISVQSTSLVNQHPEQFVTSEAKGSFALTASTRGDSVESSGRPGAPSYCEPNSADNLLLFDGENECTEVERNSLHLSRSDISPSKQSSQFNGSQNVKESGVLTTFGIPKNRAYRRRNRSRPNREGARSSSSDIAQSRSGNISSLPSRHVPKDAKGPVCETNNQKDQSMSLNSDTQPLCSTVLKVVPSNNQLEVESASGPTKDGSSHEASDIKASKNLQDNPDNQRSEDDISATLEPPCVAAVKVDNQTSSSQQNGFSNVKGDLIRLVTEGQDNSVALSTKGLDSESSCTHASLSLDEKNDSDLCTNLRNNDSNGTAKEESLVVDGEPNLEVDEVVIEKNETKVDHDCAAVKNGSITKLDEDLLDEVKYHTSMEGVESYVNTASEAERRPSNLVADNFNPEKENACSRELQGSVDSSVHELPQTALAVTCSTVAPELQTSSGMHLKLTNKAHEDSVLEEARVIQTKRKRIAELSVGTLPMENRRTSHWDFVLEEMAWLANDFAQERLWKITAPAQISRRAAFASRLRFEGQNIRWEQKKVAHTLAKAIMEFWHSAEDTSKESELCSPGKRLAVAVRAYAVRFLKSNCSPVPIGEAEAPLTPDRMSDSGALEMSWEDCLTEENLFYTVLPGAMEAYRKSIESHLVQREKTRGIMKEEVETSMHDTVSGSQENAYEEDEGETGTSFLPRSSEGNKSLKFAQKKRKNLTKSYSARSYELGADLTFTQCTENKVGTQQSVLMVKRAAHGLNDGSIPTKRVRTASRQRIISPFSAGISGCIPALNKTDASSGDTNSFQDDQSTLHGGLQIPSNLEVESIGNFKKQLPFDSAEVSTKHRKKKKAKHMGSTYEQRWQLDSSIQHEQMDHHSRKRLESHQLESNGSSGLYGQHIMKKQKMMKQSIDSSFDNLTPMTGSVPSPVASQMSNMSNPNKIIKILGGRGRKSKALKIPAGQPGSGSPWSLFEDQALVVLVHDMGPNWWLVSDAINSSLQFKCIFRKPIECRERHKILMDRTAGDGADSAEDSGSSQPYPSTLPGIPKGSARQLFQRLQGPMEEDTLKSHFEKILGTGQKLHYRRNQNDNQDIKKIQPHHSHALALSQVSPNNLNGGPPLMPFDILDATESSQDVPSLGYQGSHPSGSAISNQGSVAISNQGSSGMALGSNFSSPSGPINASVRYGVPRTSSSIDEQQRIQQYKQMLSVRNIQQSILPAPGALSGTNRPVRTIPGGNGMGTTCGVSRSMPMARPGYQGIASSSVLSNLAMPSPVNMQSGVGSGQGNSMLRPHDTLHMMRPTQNPEHQRQIMAPELQATQANNSQGVPGFGGVSSAAFSNQTAPPPAQAYPLHHHPHLQGATNAQHQAYAARLAKERHLQQRLMQQQQKQFSVSNALMQHVQSQPQLPNSSSLPNSPQIQSQTNSPQVTVSPMNPMPQHPQKHHKHPQGLTRNSQSGGSGLNHQMGKQRQRQPAPAPHQQFQQSGRHHPPQRQLSPSQQQAKLLKGLGRGTSLPNGLSATPGSQFLENLGQGLYTGSGLSPVQLSKPLVPPTHPSNHFQPNHKVNPGQTVPSSKQLQPVPSRSDNSIQGQVPPVTSGPTISASHQAVPHQKLVNQAQPAVQRVLNPNHQIGSEMLTKSQSNQARDDPQPAMNSCQTGHITKPEACTDKTKVVPVVSSASTPQRKAPEQPSDSGTSNSAAQLSTVGSSTNSGGTEAQQQVQQSQQPSSQQQSQQHLQAAGNKSLDIGSSNS